MKMKPCYKDYIWGGDMLGRVFDKNSGFDVTAESWELSAHEGGQSVIDNGCLKGMSFGEYIAREPGAAGTRCGGRFPVLIKFLDVHTALSVQVHPSDETANAENGEQGKAEVWYIVDAQPGASVYYGLNSRLTKERFAEAVGNGTVCEYLKREDAEPGQIWSVTPGVLHSASGGVLVAEVQQSSNTTFRAYDFDRVDAHGNKRELHLSRVLDVMEYEPVKSEEKRENACFCTAGYAFENLFGCRYFKLDRITLHGSMELFCDGGSFHSLLVISGSGGIVKDGKRFDFKAGDSWFMPAGIGAYETDGEAVCLLTRI